MSSVIFLALWPAHTNVKYIPAARGVKPQGCITGGAVLAFKLADVLIKASLMRDVGTGELQDTLSTKGVLEGFFADGTLAADECPLSTVPVPLNVHHAGHVAGSGSGSGTQMIIRETATRPFRRVTTERAT